MGEKRYSRMISLIMSLFSYIRLAEFGKKVFYNKFAKER
ncbi:hypothetical protein A45J_1791 [hot springs metagenome]|uniref:Uncharacterized protein n=1 Tax=hot springs metagenome TaxID=433727 RepID=A0A5J4L2Y0_9ZZZZ